MHHPTLTQDQALHWIATLFNEAPGRLTPDTARADIADWDSLGMLALMSGLDADYGIVLTDDEVLSMRGVSDILAVLRRHGQLADEPHSGL
jgi:acyl carrier protein